MSESTGGSAEESSPTFLVSNSGKKPRSNSKLMTGKLGRAQAHVPRYTTFHHRIRNTRQSKVSPITEFLYDDPTISYAPLPDHDLDQSPCYPILAKKQGYFYCELHPEIKNVHLKSIEHYIKYKDYILSGCVLSYPYYYHL